jgi:hypothetical protein
MLDSAFALIAIEFRSPFANKDTTLYYAKQLPYKIILCIVSSAHIHYRLSNIERGKGKSMEQDLHESITASNACHARKFDRVRYLLWATSRGKKKDEIL